MIWYELSYIVFAILLANLNAYLIKKGKFKKIYHPINGAIHIAASLFIGIKYWFPLTIAILCNTRIFFDYLLNIFRGEPLSYVPTKPTAISDRIEKYFFANDAYTPKLIYLILSLLINMLYFVFIKK